MRLFVALEAPPAWRQQAEAVQRALSEEFGGVVRLVDLTNLHMTLRFIGEVDDLDTPRLKAALSRHLAPVEVELRLEGVHTFGSAARTTSAWLGVEGDLDGLRGLHDRTNQAVEDALGVPYDEQGYTPHVTLGRVRKQATAAERRALAAFVSTIEVPPSEPLIAREALLIRSRLSGSGPHYETLATFS